MSAVGNVSSFASTQSIVAPRKEPETSMDRFKRKEEIRREVEYQKAKSKPREERTDRDKLVIISHTIDEMLSTPVICHANSSQALNYMA